MSIISNDPTNTKSPPSKVDFTRVQINAFVLPGRYQALEELCSAIRTAIDNQHGTINTVQVDRCTYDNERDMIDEGTDLLGRNLDYILRIKY
jgi:hypothetical protein